jgi:broad specificity phosphatase PhoE
MSLLYIFAKFRFILFIAQVLARIENALQILVETASETKTGSVAAVAHSVYLRMLLGAIQPSSLLNASTLVQKNCCVNVIDFPRLNRAKDIPVANNGIYASIRKSQKERTDRSVSITSRGHIIRINEARHVESILL